MSTAEVSTQFFYTAAGADGSRKRGLRLARSENALAEALREDGLLLLNARRLPAWTAGVSELPVRDQVAFNSQLAVLLNRGVPLVEALEVAGSVVTKRTHERVERIRSLVRAGASFADACTQVGGFDQITITVYRSAERTGDLADAARRLATAAERKQAIASKAGTLLIYPAIVISISILISIFVLTVAVPRIGEALSGAGIELPWYTELVIGLGVGLRENAVAALLVVGALAAVGIMARRVLAVGFFAVLRRVPAIRKLTTSIESARFFAVMGAMTRSGVPIGDALAVASGAVSHPELRQQLEDLRRRLVEGGVLRTLLERVEAFPLATRRLLIAAERSGDLDAAFDNLASDMAEDVDTRSARLLAMLEPLLIVAMFLVIGALLLSILVPLLSLTGEAG